MAHHVVLSCSTFFSWIERPDGSQEFNADFSESFGPIDDGKTQTERFGDVGFDDRFGIYSISGHGVLHIEADANFYPGLAAPPPDWQEGNKNPLTRNAGTLLATPGWADLPMINATPELSPRCSDSILK